LGHLGIIVSDADYAIVAPSPENGVQGAVAQLRSARHVWEEALLGFHTFNTVQQALKNQTVNFFEPMHLDILNDDMVGFPNISVCEMLDHLFMTYGNIISVDLEHNFEQMRQSWYPQQPGESLLKQFQDCADFYEAGGIIIGHPQQINVGYFKIFATKHFMSACSRWNEKPTIEKTCAQFKTHFSAAHR
jgi:hypothetical protein